MVLRRIRQFVPRPNKNKHIVIAIILIMVIVVFAISSVRNSVRSAGATVGTPVVRVSHGFRGWLFDIQTALRTKHSLQTENQNLKAQIVALTANNAERDLLAQENTELKATLGRTDTKHVILAAVLAKPSQSPYDTLLIDGGTASGFVEGQIVYAGGNTPIGYINRVLSNSAVVQLYSSPGETLDARLQPLGIDATLVGRGGGNFSMNIPHGVEVLAGATAVTKELSPKVIAIFQKITSDPRDSGQTLLLVSPVNIMHLSFVEVGQ